VLTGDGPNVGLGSRFQRVGEDMDAQARPAGIGGHGVREGFELCGYDDDRRLVLESGRDRVVNAPRGAGSSVAEPDDRDVDTGGELVELLEGPLAFVADAVAGVPDPDGSTGRVEGLLPLVEHPLPRLPGLVGA
jgi:hypothetical protein